MRRALLIALLLSGTWGCRGAAPAQSLPYFPLPLCAEEAQERLQFIGEPSFWVRANRPVYRALRLPTYGNCVCLRVEEDRTVRTEFAFGPTERRIVSVVTGGRRPGAAGADPSGLVALPPAGRHLRRRQRVSGGGARRERLSAARK